MKASPATDIMARTAIENGFPLGFVSKLAEHESWRKDIYRPMYYIHKWWARRLGSVFRAIIIGACSDRTADIADLFYSPVRFPDVVVFDPFMGSGTTVGEAAKLGCRVIGRDINPVAVTMVQAALQSYDLEQVESEFNRLESAVGEQIRSFYKTTLDNGEAAEVLYYFWVKIIPCAVCDCSVELFRDRVFSKNAMPGKRPEAKAICPKCGGINDIRHDDTRAICNLCGMRYNPQEGTFKGANVECPACHSTFSVISTVRRSDHPPLHQMYAKMVLCRDGQKRYVRISDEDRESYRRAEEMLPGLLAYIPDSTIEPGYNTNQVLNYNYQYWHQMFNARQLVCLALLAAEIAKISDSNLRAFFACLFSGTLEFNNMFASFKGEGTGAVRHMFAHHILKPELTPLEANVWGTPSSSGSFSTLYKSRILRALEYKRQPFELRVNGSKATGDKVFGISDPVDRNIVSTYQLFKSAKDVYLSQGDSSRTDLPDRSIDLVITDPPFFDNVNYSELADFFYVWLRQILDTSGTTTQESTRSPFEVQHADKDQFSGRLKAVLQECNRVLKEDGLLIFTYHHSRVEGWLAVYEAIRRAGFVITHSHPVKSEMAVSVPIKQANTPINFDLIIVCRKNAGAAQQDTHVSFEECVQEASYQVRQLLEAAIRVLPGDIMVVLMGCVLSRLSHLSDLTKELDTLRGLDDKIGQMIAEVEMEAS